MLFHFLGYDVKIHDLMAQISLQCCSNFQQHRVEGHDVIPNRLIQRCSRYFITMLFSHPFPRLNLRLFYNIFGLIVNKELSMQLHAFYHRNMYIRRNWGIVKGVIHSKLYTVLNASSLLTAVQAE
jgi:hypothetical protein